MTNSTVTDNVLITGGAGFIGSHFVHKLLKETDYNAVVVDSLSYAGVLDNLKYLFDTERFYFINADITDRAAMHSVLGLYQPRAIINFAAESHVDRSIDDPSPFIHTNYKGTFELLEAARIMLQECSKYVRDRFTFIQISTDEVYGSKPRGKSTETDVLNPSSVYSASKAAADHLALSYHKTFGMNTIVTRSSNNYGPNQLVEKFIPTVILNTMESTKIPIYGNGANERDWIYVGDNCNALLNVMYNGKAGEIYNIGTGRSISNLTIVDTILAIMQKKTYNVDGLVEFVKDRPGHDLRYCLNVNKINKLAWKAHTRLDVGLRKTIEWYIDNHEWINTVTKAGNNRRRLGV